MEFAVVVTVMLLLLIAAGPGFGDALHTWRLNGEVSRLADAIEDARLQAITKQQHVTLCPLTQVGGHPTCMPSGRQSEGDWSGGWLAYQDNDRNNRFDPRRDQMLQSGDPVDKSLLLRRTAFKTGAGRLTFNETGRLAGGQAGLFALCNRESGNAERALMVNLTGQVQKMEPARIEGLECGSAAP